jgi:hypothetical protein
MRSIESLIDFKAFPDPFSKRVSQDLEQTDPLPSGLRSQFIIPTKADLGSPDFEDGKNAVHFIF